MGTEEEEPEISFTKNEELKEDESNANECRDNSDSEGLPLPCESLIVLCNLKNARITNTCKKTCGLCGNEENQLDEQNENLENEEKKEEEKTVQKEEIVDCLSLPEDHANCSVWMVNIE